MKGFYIAKLMIFCVLLTGMLHVPALMIAQQKIQNEKIQIYDLPISNHQIQLEGNYGGIREDVSARSLEITALVPTATMSNIVVPYKPHNIKDNATFEIFLNRGDGIFLPHDSAYLSESANNQIQTTLLGFPQPGETFSILIQGCQSPGDCTSVVVIVTVDGTRSSYILSPN